MKKIVLILMIFAFSGCGRNDSMEIAEPTPSPVSTPMPTVEYTVADESSIDDEMPPVYLEVTDDAYSLMLDDYLSYTIVNTTGKSINVLLIPLLEKKNAEVWEVAPTVGVGFCGVPDSVEKVLNGKVPLEWYADSLTSGLYRLSFTTTDDDYNERTKLISNNFTLD